MLIPYLSTMCIDMNYIGSSHNSCLDWENLLILSVHIQISLFSTYCIYAELGVHPDIFDPLNNEIHQC